jgi:amino acid adenylation domain-containing protein
VSDSHESRVELTAGQRLIWSGQQLSPGSPLYNMAIRVDFSSALDAERFRAAFQSVVEQSDAMRAVFDGTDAGPAATLLPHAPSRFDVIDVSRDPDPEQAADVWIADRVRRPFDLSAATFDAALLRLGPERWTWFFDQHHVATDAWSTALVYRRVAQVYARPDAVHPGPSFAEQVALERRSIGSAAFAAASEHWREREKRAGRPPRLYGRAPHGTRGESCRIAAAFGAERTERLARLAAADDVQLLTPDLTRFAILATALAAYAWRVSGERAFTIGAPAHNRRTKAARETIGPFVEVFPLGIAIEDGDTFRTLLARVAGETNALLLNGLPGTSGPSTARLFNVVLNYLNASFGPFGDIPARVEWLHPGAIDPAHMLRVHVHDLGGRGALEALFDVNTSAIDPELASRMPRHFLRVLDAMLADPDSTIAGTALALEEDVAAVHASAREATARTDVDGETVISLFDARAEETPGAIAIRLGDTRVTYRELADVSHATARALLARGVAPGDRVGIHATRSIELVVAVLGVLRAGAAYVPLEARMPEDRLRLVLGDTQARLVLAHATGTIIPGIEPLTVDAAVSTPGDAVPAAASPDGAAYVIYTSGSTGRPKGVVVDHRGLAGYVRWAHRSFAGGGPASMPLHTAFGFDLTVTSLFVPLVSGGTIVIYPEPSGGVDFSCLQVFEDDAVDVVKLTPGHLGLVADGARRPQRIRSLVVGGEDLKTDLARRAVAALGDRVAIFNEYGPTEAVVGCMKHRFDPSIDGGVSVPIGRAAEGVAIYVLDDGLNPVPEGVEGEIFVGGDRLARGYEGREDLTAERFVPDPFRPGHRMYRTGDRARIARGLVEYLGRADQQVKIRGVRVEPAEVEYALAAHPAIRACVVDVVAGAGSRRQGEERRCRRCGLGSRYPGTTFDTEGVCNLCRDFERYRDRVRAYFRPMDDLRRLLEEAAARRTGPYDCLVLLSGGKDSTYALYQLARMTPRVLAMTLDIGYLSDGAKANIRRATESLGIEHRFVTTPAIKTILVDSLERHANVCNGCFKTIYTMAVQVALAEGIPAIVTGLSRGQFFETRLTSELFLDEKADPDQIDRLVLEARKAYHRADDAVSQCLDVSALRLDETYEKVQFVDFYRYCDVSLDEMYRFLAEHAPWTRPSDTGRSTNCRLNEVGIFVHTRTQGFHNYALPYSWDVRLGHKTRDAALEELDDEIDPPRVAALLQELGYEGDVFDDGAGPRLAAFYTADEPIGPAALRAHLAARLTEPMIPSYFVQLAAIPLTASGKVDRGALPDPRTVRVTSAPTYRAPGTPVERALAECWRQVLRVDRVGLDDDFYDLGGDSIAAIRIAARARNDGLDVSAPDLFNHPTVGTLAPVVNARPGTIAGSSQDRPEPTPVPARFELANLDAARLERISRLLENRRSGG